MPNTLNQQKIRKALLNLPETGLNETTTWKSGTDQALLERRAVLGELGAPQPLAQLPGAAQEGGPGGPGVLGGPGGREAERARFQAPHRCARLGACRGLVGNFACCAAREEVH